MKDCLFCRIIKKEIPAEIVYEDENLIAFKDINPKAPVHLLIVPKTHLVSVAEIEEKDLPLISSLIWRAKILAEKFKIAKNGYRLIFNCRSHAGQVVDHLHLHLIGGKKLKE